MKKTIGKLMAILLASVMAVGIAPASKIHAAEKSVLYVALGDSLTDYATYEGKNWTSYPAYVSETVTNKTGINVVVKNDAIGGFLADDVNNQLSKDSVVINDIKNADVVSVMIGGNDMFGAVALALAEQGYGLENLVGAASITPSSPVYKIAYSVLSDKNNPYHRVLITGIDTKIKTIISTIREYNPGCEIAIATLYYNNKTGISFLSDVTGMNIWNSYLFSLAYSSAVSEMQGYFKKVAAADAHVTYVNVDSIANATYNQHDARGKFIDFHPNKAGQQEFAKCFYNDFWAKLDVQALATDEEIVADDIPVTRMYKFNTINDSQYLASNVVLGDVTTLSINENGIGSKMYSSETDSRTFEYNLKPIKAAGVLTGVSFWDNSNMTEVLLRFEGTNTKYINVCVGGNGKYITKQLSLGFDASTGEHTYNVSFDTDKVVLTVDGKQIGTVNISTVNSPVSHITPIVFVEKADWAGTFAGKKVTASLSNFH